MKQPDDNSQPTETPSTFEPLKDLRWSSTGPLLCPSTVLDRGLVSIKDPTVVHFEGRYHVFASTVSRAGAYNMVYLSFATFEEAPSVPWYHMDQTKGFDTYVAAPQLFYFAPQKLWYLVFQSGPPMYSTTRDVSDPTSWSVPKPFFTKTPTIIEENTGWLDFWVIGDDQFAYLFFSDDGGRFYLSRTPLARFPFGFSDPTIVLQDPIAGRLYEACNVYRIQETGDYLALIEAFDDSSNQRRYFRAFTARNLSGPWSVLNDDARLPFAGESNVTFESEPWTRDISHGEMVRHCIDETMTLSLSSLRYLYQGFEPTFDTSDYNAIPWKLGLLLPRGCG